MRARALAILLLLCGVAQAQIYSPGAANVGNHGPICPGMGALCAPVPAVSYTGAGDTVASAKAYWGVFAYNAAGRGTKALRLCNVGLVACADVNTDATTGIVSSTQVIGSITCGSGANLCRVTTAYDMSGGSNCSGVCDLTQATEANMPAFTPNASGTIPGITCLTGGSRILIKSSGFTTIAQPYTLITGASSAFDSGANEFIGGTASIVGLGSQDTNSFLDIFAGSYLTTAAKTANQLYALIGDTDASGNGRLLVNGTLTTGSISTSATGTSFALCGLSDNSHFLDGTILEFGVWASQFSTGNETAMNSNMRARGGY